MPAEEFAALVMSAAEDLPALPSQIHQENAALTARYSTPPDRISEPDKSGRYSLADVSAQEAVLTRKLRKMNRALSAGDFETAFQAASQALEILPWHPEALAFVDTYQEKVQAALVDKFGGMEARFELHASDDQLAELQTDSQQALLLSMLDGDFTLAEILETAPDHQLEILRWVNELVKLGVLGVF
jgi:hypothetical protein